MKKPFIAVFVLCVMVFATISCTKSKSGGEVNDKIYSPFFTGTYMVYVMNPNQLAGWSRVLVSREQRYIPEKYADLPVYGGWWGGDVMEKELLVRDKIKRALVISTGIISEDRITELYALGMDVTVLRASGIEEQPRLLRELGQYMGMPDRAEELARYGEEAIARVREMVKDIPEEQKVRVYLAGGPTGLSATCSSEILDMAGGLNVFECPDNASRSMQISYEQLINFNPDIFFFTQPDFPKNDPKWKLFMERKGKDAKMVIVPHSVFGWMHMPEVMRFITIQWMACELYPDRCTIDVHEETKKFAKLFLHLELDDAEVTKILNVEN